MAESGALLEHCQPLPPRGLQNLGCGWPPLPPAPHNLQWHTGTLLRLCWPAAVQRHTEASHRLHQPRLSDVRRDDWCQWMQLWRREH